LGRTSAVRSRFIRAAYRHELVNGLYAKVKFGFSNKEPLEGFNLGAIVEFYQTIDTGGVDFLNEPIAFDPYRATLLELKFQYRFKQKYIIKNNEKLIIGTEYPELEVGFKQGIPNLFGSEVRFNSVEFKVSDEINLGNYDDSKWKVIRGYIFE